MCRDIPLKGGMEFDALTNWRKAYNFKSGVRQEVKRKFNRRERRIIRKRIRESISEYITDAREECTT